MPNIGPMELALIAFVALLLFGAGRIAAVGKGLGQAVREFKQGIRDEPEGRNDNAKS